MSDWLLTTEEEAAAIAQAEANKASHKDWCNRAAGLGGISVKSLPLTEEDAKKTLETANNIKHFNGVTELLKSKSRERQREAREELTEFWDYIAFLKYMRERSDQQGVKLIENEDTLPLIKAICFKLSRNERYETELGFSFNKGLIIHGEPGLGKSYLWQLVADNEFCNVQIITMHEIVRDVIEKGDYTGLKFMSYGLIYIDDVGTEYFGDNAIKRYGTDINWFKNFIEEYYAKSKHCFNRIIISTNDNAAELGKKYGFRVRDRLAEMFDILEVSGKNLRR